MNNLERAAQLELAAKILRNNLPWEVQCNISKDRDIVEMAWFEGGGCFNLHRKVFDGCPIRLKPVLELPGSVPSKGGDGAVVELEIHSPDWIGQTITALEMGCLDDDLKAPFEGLEWQRVRSAELVQIQIARHLKQILSSK